MIELPKVDDVIDKVKIMAYLVCNKQIDDAIARAIMEAQREIHMEYLKRWSST